MVRELLYICCISRLGIHQCGVCQGASDELVSKIKSVVVHMLHKCCLPLLWYFVPFYRCLLLKMGINASLYDYGSVGNEWGDNIDFNGLLPVGSSVILLHVWRVNRYLCHLWRTHLMYVVVVHHMNNAGFRGGATWHACIVLFYINNYFFMWH